MGYTTDFNGAFEITGVMSREFVEFINRFSRTRRMKRSSEKIKEIFPNWKEFCFNGELGVEGEYFARQSDCFGQERDVSILEYNEPAKTQPGLWCQWIISTNEDIRDDEIQEFTGKLEWDGGEKFYEYDKWLAYLIKNFFIPMGFELNGAVRCVGEDSDDATYIVVSHNQIEWVGAYSETILDELKERYGDNEEVVDKLEEVGLTPDEIRDQYFSWLDDEED